MIFDYDSKAIGFYDNNIVNEKEDSGNNFIENKKEENNNNSTNRNEGNKGSNNIKEKIFKNIIQYIIFFIIIIGTFFLGMKIKESRKKKANELKDDDFEYSSYNIKNENLNGSQNIELNKIGI